MPGVHLAHAATAIGPTADDAEPPLLATGGRVLNVVAVGTDFAEARRRAYEALGHAAARGRPVPHRHRRARRRLSEHRVIRVGGRPSREETVMTDTDDLPGWTHVYSGKVRDLYVPTELLDDDDSWTGDPLRLSPVVLVVASDRVSAFDQVLEPAIPGKGAMLTRLTRWWFDQLPEVPNHLAYAEDDRLEACRRSPPAVADRATLCRTLDMFPIECVVRGYLTGGG